MSIASTDPSAPDVGVERRGIRLGDVFFKGIALLAAVGVAAVLGLLTYEIFELAWPAMQEYGLSFIWTQGWNPNSNVYGALVFIYGTVVTAFIALLLRWGIILQLFGQLILFGIITWRNMTTPRETRITK